MNKRQLKIVPVKQRYNSVFRHYNATNDLDKGKPSKPEIKVGRLNLFDILNDAFLGTYREVFNAWDPKESKVFTFLKTAYAWLIQVAKNNAKAPLTLQLIPIDPKQNDVFVEMRRPTENGN